MKQIFAKIIDHPDTQILIRKGTNDEDSPAVICQFEIKGANAEMVFGFEREDVRDAMFDDHPDENWIAIVDEQKRMHEPHLVLKNCPHCGEQLSEVQVYNNELIMSVCENGECGRYCERVEK